MKENYCFTPGPPHWHWSDMPEIHAENAPDSASIIPGDKEVIKSTEKVLPSTDNRMEESESEIRKGFLDLLDMLGDGYADNRLPAYNLYDELEMPRGYKNGEEYAEYQRLYEPQGYGWEDQEKNTRPLMDNNMEYLRGADQ